MLKKINKFLFVVLAIALMAAAFVGCSQSTAADKTISVKVASVAKQPLDANISIAGVLNPAATVSISGKLSGNVLTINTDVGQSVKKGDTLISLETKQLSAQLEQAQAALKAAKASVKTAKSSSSAAHYGAKAVKGQASLAKINLDAAEKALDFVKEAAKIPLSGVTQGDVLKAQAAYDAAKQTYANASGASVSQANSSAGSASNAVSAAQANVDVSEANVNIILVQMENSDIKSPIDGVVINRNINVGELASPGVSLLTVADNNTLKLKGTVSQEVLPFISEGESVSVTVDIYPGTPYEGKISLIGPMAVATGEYFPIEISLANPGTLKPGLSAHADISVKSQQNLVVPTSAVIKAKDKSYVYIADNGKAVKREVTTGLGNTNNIEILNGLKEGEQVIVSNADILSDNLPVRVQENSSAQK